ncbi:MAG: hypothetical protein JRD69_09895 [Deltaproteobacteria bacterium]|nr:hypothetical protein [Deltaproteobacteria bacterium]
MSSIDELLRPLIDDAVARGVIAPSVNALIDVELRRIARNSDLVSGWTRGGGDMPTFTSFNAEKGHFDFMPLQMARFLRTAEQSIPDDVSHALQFDNVELRDSTFLFDSAAPTKIQLTGRQTDRLYIVMGAVNFAANVTGIRSVGIIQYDAGDNVLESDAVASINALTALASIVPFASAISVNSETAYIEIAAIQTSGDALNIKNNIVNIFRGF